MSEWSDPEPGIVIVILAAGSSSRLGQAKQRLNIGGKTLLQTQIDEAKKLCLPVYVVLGAHVDEIEREIHADVAVLRNKRWEEGLSTSVLHAVDSVKADGWLFMTVDQYRVDAVHLQCLLDRSREQPDAIMASAYNEILGVPAVIPASLADALSKLKGDQGAGKIIRQMKISNPEQVIEVESPLCNIDLDTPQDLKEFNQYCQLKHKQVSA